MRFARLVLGWMALASFAACSARTQGPSDEGAFTSRTAQQRELAFEGVVYVVPGTSNDSIVDLVKQQAITAMGALRSSEMMAEDRELHSIDPSTFKMRDVLVVDPAAAPASSPQPAPVDLDGGDDAATQVGDAGTEDAATPGPAEGTRPMVEVRYTYRDTIAIGSDAKLGDRTSFSTALLNANWADDPDLTVHECVGSDPEERETSEEGYLWYYFNPTLDRCKSAILKEAATVEHDKKVIADAIARTAAAADGAPSPSGDSADNRIPKSQTTRRFYPVTMALATPATTRGATYPEYDSLFRGGVASGKLVIGILDGRLETDVVEAPLDEGYWEWLSTLQTLFAAHPDFALTSIEPNEDLSTLTATNRTFTGLTLNDYIGWTIDSRYPASLNPAQKKALRMAGGRKLDKHWLTFQKKIKVAIGDEAPRDFTIELVTYFGVVDEIDPYQRMMKSSDVFVYNGHSILGGGPLDPSNYVADDFPSTYQLWFLDGCISYNYYNRDFFPLKGGSKNLDLIVNGLEAPADYGGQAEAKLLIRLLSGKQPSYKELLLAARATDPMRIVEGDGDNSYSPRMSPISISGP